MVFSHFITMIFGYQILQHPILVSFTNASYCYRKIIANIIIRFLLQVFLECNGPSSNTMYSNCLNCMVKYLCGAETMLFMVVFQNNFFVYV